jgi:hypothetical protein
MNLGSKEASRRGNRKAENDARNAHMGIRMVDENDLDCG